MNDKDGISAALVMTNLIHDLYSKPGGSLSSYLSNIQRTFGLSVSYNGYLKCPPLDPAALAAFTKKIFDCLRPGNSSGSLEYWPWSKGPGYCPSSVLRLRDVTRGYDSNGDAGLPITPESEMLMFEFENGCSITIRGSGTEPKIKYYCELVGQPGENEMVLREKLINLSKWCIQEMLQPEVNGLI